MRTNCIGASRIQLRNCLEKGVGSQRQVCQSQTVSTEGSPQNLFGTVLAQLGQIGPMEQQFCWEVLYNHYVLHVGA